MKRKITEGYIYSRSAAQRIFDAEVKRVDIYANSVLVIFEKGQKLRPRFVAKSAFKEHFARWRQGKARTEVIVSYRPLNGTFHAIKSSNITEYYQIELYPDHLTCTCKDYEIQEELGIEKPACKHIYATLDYIGCTSIADYIERDGMSFLDTNETLHQWNDPLKDYHDEMMSYGY